MPDAPPTPPLGLLIIGVGVAIILIGVLVWTGALNWFGRLPGDIRYESGSTRIYVPLASMLVISVTLSLLAAAVRRFF